jgi:hypothetical protein
LAQGVDTVFALGFIEQLRLTALVDHRHWHTALE